MRKSSDTNQHQDSPDRVSGNTTILQVFLDRKLTFVRDSAAWLGCCTRDDVQRDHEVNALSC